MVLLPRSYFRFQSFAHAQHRNTAAAASPAADDASHSLKNKTSPDTLRPTAGGQEPSTLTEPRGFWSCIKEKKEKQKEGRAGTNP